MIVEGGTVASSKSSLMCSQIGCKGRGAYVKSTRMLPRWGGRGRGGEINSQPIEFFKDRGGRKLVIYLNQILKYLANL